MPDGGSVTDEERRPYAVHDEGRINGMRNYVGTAKQIKNHGLGKWRMPWPQCPA